MTSFDKDIQLENLARTNVVGELEVWNIIRLTKNSIKRRIIDSTNITFTKYLYTPLLSDHCTVNEYNLLNPISMDIDYKSWERCINWDLFNKIVLVNAYRIALIFHTTEFTDGARLPSGLKVPSEDYDIFMQSINRNPKLSEKMFMTQIIAKVGISSIQSLASYVANLDRDIYLEDIEKCAIQMKKI
jgi:hypothetical protein